MKKIALLMMSIMIVMVWGGYGYNWGLKWLLPKSSTLEQARQDILKTMNENREKIKQLRSAFEEEFGKINQFLPEDISEDDKEAVHTVVTEHRKDVKAKTQAFIKEFDDRATQEATVNEFVDDLVSDKEALFEELESFIDEDEVDEYNEYVEQFLGTFEEAKTTRINGALDRKQSLEKRYEQRVYHLSDSFQARVDKLVDQLPADQFEKFVENAKVVIEKKIKQIEANDKLPAETQEKLTQILEELLDLLQEAVDGLETAASIAEDAVLTIE